MSPAITSSPTAFRDEKRVHVGAYNTVVEVGSIPLASSTLSRVRLPSTRQSLFGMPTRRMAELPLSIVPLAM